MIAGAAQADLALLVVDASTGEFESGFNLHGQTKEHAILVRSMGISKLIIAVNKMDMANWSAARFHSIREEMIPFLQNAGFQLSKLRFIPCSGLHGDNVFYGSKGELAAWWKSGTIVDEIETTSPATRDLDRSMRMSLFDVYKGGITGGILISGRMESGSVQTADELLAMPSGEKLVVKSLSVDDEPRQWVAAGDNVSMEVTGIDMMHLRPGDIVCALQEPVKLVSRFRARLISFEMSRPITIGTMVSRNKCTC